jgi:hypothetical protein
MNNNSRIPTLTIAGIVLLVVIVLAVITGLLYTQNVILQDQVTELREELEQRD